MENLRKYGNPPYSIAVIHGGPGAAGEMAPVAMALSKKIGILEPLQTKDSLEGQIIELDDTLKNNGFLPFTLIGYSWGAMLSFIYSARFPASVKKLIMVSSGVFDEKYAPGIMETRLKRLKIAEREEALEIMKKLSGSLKEKNNKLLARLGSLFSKSDSYDPIINESNDIAVDENIYKNVWKDAVELRKGRGLLDLGKFIKCPVIAIHGDYDPHPAEGIRDPLSGILKDFNFITLKDCGHTPCMKSRRKQNFSIF